MFLSPAELQGLCAKAGVLPLSLLMDRLHLRDIQYVSQLSLHGGQHL